MSDWRYVALDESRHYTDPAFVERCGRIFGIYVFDASVGVHCCELLPSYELYYVRSEPERWPDDDTESVFDYLMEANTDTEPVIYVHCHTIDVDKCKKVSFEDDGADFREQADHVIEEANANWVDVPYPG